LLVVQPILLRIVQGINHLRDKFILFSNLQHSACVFVSATVVRGAEHCEELTTCKALKTVHHTLMRAQDEFHFVVLKEVLHTIRTELDDITCAVRVPDKVWLNAELVVTVGGVRPQDVDDQLLLRV
jgi:hypothetical protein